MDSGRIWQSLDQACRFGLDGNIVHPRTHETYSLREDILTTLRKMEPYAEKMEGQAAFEHLYQITHTGSDASFLRQYHTEHGSLESTVDAAIQRFREGYL